MSMKKFVKPQMRIMSIVINENIASSAGMGGICSLNNSYTPTQQKCQKCKLYYAKYGHVPSGINIESGGIKNFCDTYGLGYASKENAIAAASTMSCPEGLA